jgi:hypothetical protein
MSGLAEYQRSIRDLLKNRATGETRDPHLEEVARLPELVLLRDIAVWWREMAVDANCVWTAGLLRKYGIFHPLVESFYCNANVSPYVELASEQFLARLSGHDDPLIASLAQFELAVMKVRQGDTQEHRIAWDRNPDEVFVCLKSASDVPPTDPDWSYITYVSQQIPDLVRCDRVARNQDLTTEPRRH